MEKCALMWMKVKIVRRNKRVGIANRCSRMSGPSIEESRWLKQKTISLKRIFWFLIVDPIIQSSQTNNWAVSSIIVKGKNLFRKNVSWKKVFRFFSLGNPDRGHPFNLTAWRKRIFGFSKKKSISKQNHGSKKYTLWRWKSRALAVAVI